MSAGFLAGYAAALAAAGFGTGADTLTSAEEEMVLELARIVAHATARKNAPLATYLTGLAIAAGPRDAAREALLARALEIARMAAGEGAGTS
jgi:hypothetical protein